MSKEQFKFFVSIYTVCSLFLGILLSIHEFIALSSPLIISAINESYSNLTQQINSLNISQDQKILLLNNAKEIYQTAYTKYTQIRPIPPHEFIIDELILIVPPLILYCLISGKSNKSEEKNDESQGERKNHDE